MRNRTFVIVLVVAALILAGALTVDANHGAAIHRWLAAIHGR